MRRALAIVALGLVTASPAGAVPVGVTVEPLAGFERVEKLFPERHFINRFFYGVLVTGGVPLVALEAEYTRGRDDERFPDLGITQVDDIDRLKIGARSHFRLTSAIWTFARAGVQATKFTRTRGEAGVTTVTSLPIQYDPYAGLGLQVRLAASIQGELGVTVIFKDFPRMAHNDYQVHAGFSIKLGSDRR